MTIQDELLAIKGDNEFLTAEDVVTWARSHPESELYKAPEFMKWDQKKAAYQHWLWTARKLIALHIVYADGERKFISLSFDRTREHGGYRAIDDVLRDKGLHEIMLADALREFERIERTYERLMALKPIWREVAKVRGGTKHSAARNSKARRAEQSVA